MSMAATQASDRVRPMTAEEKKVIFASSLGTVFEWYDFYLYGSLATIIGAQFFSQFDENNRNIFALLAFAAGFIVRPFGALVFGRIGDLVGRKYTFLVTILIMGLSTFIVGLLPSSTSIGITAPIILIGLRLLQGLALCGEYGGAATYVAEHARQGRLDPAAAQRVTRLQEDEGRGYRFQGSAVGSLRTVEEPEVRDHRAVRPRRRPGRGLVHGPVLRPVLPAEHPEGRRLHRQPSDRMVAARRHARLRAVRLAVRQDRPQADHPRGLPACRPHLLPAVHGARRGRKPHADQG